MRWLFIVLLVAGLSGVSGCAGQGGSEFRNTDITGSAIGGSLHGLKDSQGKERALEDFRGKAVIVFFGYTSCPDVCPTTLSRLAGIMKQLGNDRRRVQVLLVTVDPAYDTPERLAAYVSAFDPAFIGLSGDASTTEAVTQDFKVFVAQHHDGHDHGSSRAVDHTTGAYIFDRAGKIRLYVKDDAPDEAILADLKRLLASG